MEQVPIKIARQIAGKCLYSGCDQDALRDSKGEIESDYCGPHDAHERGRDAGKKRRRRQRLANQGKCIDGCGRKVAKKRRPNGSILQRRCRPCSKAKLASEREARKKRGVPEVGSGVPGTPSKGFWKSEEGTHAWGSGKYQTTRFVGHARRGRLSREEQWAEQERDANEMIRMAQDFIRRGRRYHEDKLYDLPPIQRDEARSLVAEPLGRLGRVRDELEDAWDS